MAKTTRTTTKVASSLEIKPTTKKAVEINLPENLSSYLTPIVVMFGTILIAVSIFVVGLKIEKSIKGVSITTTTVADTSAQDQAQAQAQPEVAITQDMLSALFDKNVIKFGDRNSKLIFAEFSDPSCPYCHVSGGYNPELSVQIGAQFTYASQGGTYIPPVPEMQKLVDAGKAAFVYVFTVGHGNGELAAKALYCANDQGNFWPVHSKLMNNDGYKLMNEGDGNTSVDSLATFLSDKTDKTKLTDCLNSGKYDSVITENVQTASEYGVNGTPGFLVNTAKFAGAYSFSDMQPTVDAALQ